MKALQKTPVTKLFRWLRNKTHGQAIPTGFTPIDQFLPNDIFIVGYPKSGNTWFQDLVAGIAFGALPEFAPLHLVQDLVPDSHAVRYYKRYGKNAFFKSHSLPRPDFRRVVYLMRDGRDAMVSLLHYREALERKKYDFLGLVTADRSQFPGKWHEHIQAWLANPFHAEMIVIKYEDLKTNTALELQRFCDFAGLKRSPEFLQQIAESTAFEKMQAKEAVEGPCSPLWPKDKAFRRRGAVGSYKDEMPSDALNAFIKESGSVLRQCGYLL
ncbi:MAG: Sulfotransferase [Pedosphaera sp.]|nr:Sulfotransferase [Pedosphaera sp.]